MATRRRSIRVGVRLRPAAGACRRRVDSSRARRCPRSRRALFERAPRESLRFDDVFDARGQRRGLRASRERRRRRRAARQRGALRLRPGRASKTHTMQGTPESPGLIPRAVVDVFETYQRCRVSYVESYNERVRDLLGDADDLRVLDGGPVGRREVDVASVEAVFAAITRGERRRSVGATPYNTCVSGRRDPDAPWNNGAALTFVDLAGSEATASAEGHCINRSLHALALVIAKLADGHWICRDRDSKLTRLLRPALSGRVTLVCTVAPDAGEETTNTLHFARRATRVVQAPVPRASPLVERYRQQMDALRTELQAPHEVLPPEPPAREGVRAAIADLERLIVTFRRWSRRRPSAAAGSRCRPRGRSSSSRSRATTTAPRRQSACRRPESPCSPPSRSFPATGGRPHTAAADPRSPEFPPSTPSAPMDTAALREVQRKLRGALARSEPDENLFAAAEGQLARAPRQVGSREQSHQGGAHGRLLALAARERAELVKMKGLATLESSRRTKYG